MANHNKIGSKLMIVTFVMMMLMFGSAFLVISTPSASAVEDSDGDKITDDLENKFRDTPAGEKVRVIIKLDEIREGNIDNIESGAGEKVGKRLDMVDAVTIEVPPQAAEKIAQRPFVERVEADYNVKTVLDSSSVQINANDVWNKNITGEGVDVSVIDTGIYDEHNALSDDVEKEKDFTGSGSTNDNNGHGTHVAGIVSSEDSTYKGIAPDADLYNAKVLTSDGSGYASDVIDGIEWSVNEGAEVISISLGASVDPCDGTDILSEAVDQAVSDGVTTVVAAGNTGPDSGTITSPGCSKKGITIGAVDDNDNVPDFSSRGPTDDGRVKPDVVAPGVSITSSWNDGNFNSLSGTSMSTPHVSGIASLLLAVNSSLQPGDVKDVLKTNALDLGLDENTQGSGRVQAYESVKEFLKPSISIIEFITSEDDIYVNDSVNVSLTVENKGDLTAEDVNAVLDLPSGLTSADSLEKSIGNVQTGESSSEEWSVEGDQEGNYTISVSVNSSNDGVDSSETTLSVLTNDTQIPDNETDNETGDNETELPDDDNQTDNETGDNETTLPDDDNETDNETGFPDNDNQTEEDNETERSCDWLPPGLRDKDTLPLGWQKKCPEAGATPGSVWHGFEKAGEGLKLAFTFNKEKKAEYKLKLSEERLAEAAKLLKEGKTKQAEKALSGYEKSLEDVREYLNSSEVGEDKKDKFSNLSSKVATSTSFHKNVLEDISEKVPEEGRKGIKRALEASNKSSKTSLQKLEETSPDKAAQVQKEIAEREVKVVENQIREGKKEKDSEKKEEKLEKLQERKEKMKEKAEEAKEKAKERAEERREREDENNETEEDRGKDGDEDSVVDAEPGEGVEEGKGPQDEEEKNNAEEETEEDEKEDDQGKDVSEGKGPQEDKEENGDETEEGKGEDVGKSEGSQEEKEDEAGSGEEENDQEQDKEDQPDENGNQPEQPDQGVGEDPQEEDESDESMDEEGEQEQNNEKEEDETGQDEEEQDQPNQDEEGSNEEDEGSDDGESDNGYDESDDSEGTNEEEDSEEENSPVGGEDSEDESDNGANGGDDSGNEGSEGGDDSNEDNSDGDEGSNSGGNSDDKESNERNSRDQGSDSGKGGNSGNGGGNGKGLSGIVGDIIGIFSI